MEALAPLAAPQPPLLARLNWYWILQVLAWTLIVIAFMIVFSTVLCETP